MSGFIKVQSVFQRDYGSGQPAQDVCVCDHAFAIPDGGDWQGLPPLDLAPLCDLIETFWTDIANWIADEFSILEYRCYRADGAFGPLGPAEYVQAGTMAGTNSNAPLPPQIAETVTIRVADRRHWGRFYVPGLTVNSLTAGRLQSALVDDFANGAQAIYTSQTVGGSADCVGGVGRAAPGSPPQWFFDPALFISADNIADVQRRRRMELQTHRTIVPN